MPDQRPEESVTRLRRTNDAMTSPGSLVGIYVGAVVVISVLGVVGVVTVLIVQPQNNTAAIATILGFLMPVVTALLAAAVREIKVTIDGRMSEVLMLTSRAAGAEAALAEKEKTLALAMTLPAVPSPAEQAQIDAAAHTTPTPIPPVPPQK